MKKQKYYVVANGRKNGIYLNWDDCKEMVQGFPNALYRAFEEPYKAMDFLLENTSGNVSEKVKETTTNDCNKNVDENHHNAVIEAYVDGSFDSSTNTYGSGVVILKNGNIIEQLSIKGDNEELLSMNNVAGEINAALLAMKYCYNNNYDNLTIYYDYNGIEKWATGEWKANKKGTQEYRQLANLYAKRLNIKFVKVKAHSGNQYNELADKLAKQSINL